MLNRKPTQLEIANSVNKSVPDIIRPNLTILFCGINPGLYTAAIGCHFGRPGNRFWKALFEGGFTPRLFDPREQNELLNLNLGITNLVNRATNTAAELSTEELIIGKTKLQKKVLEYRPKWLAVVGIDSYRKAFQDPEAKLGIQSSRIGQTQIWVLPNPSGLNAHYTPKILAQLFHDLKSVAS